MDEKLIDTPSGRIAVQSYGGSGRDVLFVHGPGFCGPHFRHFAEAIADRCRPVTLDLPGHAHTTVPMRSADDQWRCIADAVRGADLHRPVLVAHDTSIWAAVVAAIREPAAFSALMLYGGTITRLSQSAELADDPEMVRGLEQRFHLGQTGVGRESAEALCHEMAAHADEDWMLADLSPGYYEETWHSIVFGPDDTWMHTPTGATVRNAHRFDPQDEFYPALTLFPRLAVPTWFVSLDRGYDANVELDDDVFAEAPMLRRRSIDSGQFPHYSNVSELAEILDEVLESTDAD